ncbi:MAG: VWA domain-containing protein [Bacteroidales bacterium]|jgi:Ca-activated chloride channel family protein|nr:VWA domain-containing protein [Bacteroidales bacterium]MBQ3914326.1 VWA domain-containing protein [Paludibacteraceae bacterium]MBR4546614.1 VWA domain-containing protein [Paludibacteraceae bacterium]MBR6145637.1 VWA domain-containing protein [Paludibacteraceae bacterium]
MTFANPGYLFLLLLLAPVIFWYLRELHKSDASLQIASTDVLGKQPRTARLYMLHLPFLLRCAAIILLTVCLARPQLSNRWSKESTEGIDIMMAMDISGTMLAEDLKPNRLEAAKQVATEFISDRPNDNIGLVVFAGESFTQCPLTTDHAVLINLFRSVKFGMIDDGTAIGLGLANAVNRMKDSPTKSKVIILLTDGSNNCGDIDPMTAAEIAHTFGIRVYAIGVGSKGEARIPYQTPIGTQYTTVSGQFDENTLRQIAATTDGQYFRATDNATLKAIYQEIDQMEKTKIRVREFSKKSENFAPYLWAAAICLLLEILLRFFVLRTISN